MRPSRISRRAAPCACALLCAVLPSAGVTQVPELAIGPELPLHASALPQERPAVASNGAEFLVAWIENDQGSLAVRAARVGLGGAPLDPDAIAIATGLTGFTDAAVASDGSGFLVAWIGADGNVVATRLDASGLVLDPLGIALSARPGFRASSLAAASSGDGYLVAFSGESFVAPEMSVEAVLVGSTGTLLDARVFEELPIDFYGLNDAAAAFAPGGYLVAWRRFVNEYVQQPAGGSSVHAARFGDAPFPISAPPAGGVSHYSPAVAPDGDGWLVTWRTAGDAPESQFVAAARVPAAPSVLPLAPIQAGNTGPVTVVADGRGHLFAWTFQSPVTSTNDLGIAALDAVTGVISSADVPTAGTYEAWEPALANAAAGTSLLAYAREAAIRLRVLHVGWPPLGATPAGTDVAVVPADAATGGAPPLGVELEFASVTAAGTTTVDVSAEPSIPAPEGWFVVDALAAAPQYLDFSTTATYAGPVRIVLRYDPVALGLSPAEESALRLLHYACDAAGPCAWHDVTAPVVPNPDVEAHVLQGVTDTLSPFAFAIPLASRPESTFEWSGLLPPIQADAGQTFRLGRTIPLKFQLTGRSAGIADLAPRLFLEKLSTVAEGAVEELLPVAGADAGSVFRYDPAADQYVYNLSTGGLSQGTWALRVELYDGVRREIVVRLRR